MRMQFQGSKFVCNNYGSQQPVLQAQGMTTTMYGDGTSVSNVTNGVLTNGTVMLPVSGIVRRYEDGRIEVNGALIDWAALMANAQLAPQAAPPLRLPAPLPDEAPLQEGESACVVCLERAVKTVITDCGHAAYCVTCACTTVKEGTLCPVCRTRITSVIRVFET